MANIKSQIKRNKQSIKRNEKNRQVKSTIRTARKKVTQIIDNNEVENKELVLEYLKKYIKSIDKAAQKGIYKFTTVARYKSRITKKVNAFTDSL